MPTVLKDRPGMFLECEFSGREKVPHHVKKERGREADRVDSVENPTVPLDESPEIFHPFVSLDGRHSQPAGESG